MMWKAILPTEMLLCSYIRSTDQNLAKSNSSFLSVVQTYQEKKEIHSRK